MQPDLIDLLTPELREKALSGEVVVSPGQNPNKPVVQDARTKRLVKGSGRWPKANDIGVISKSTAWKRTRTFTEYFDQFIPSTKAENPDAIISLEELVDLAAQAARGWHKWVETKCPECSHSYKVELQDKPDTKLLSFLIERRVGKAKETQEINVRSEEIIRMMTDSRPVVEVIDITPEERAERALAVRNYNPDETE